MYSYCGQPDCAHVILRYRGRDAIAQLSMWSDLRVNTVHTVPGPALADEIVNALKTYCSVQGGVIYGTECGRECATARGDTHPARAWVGDRLGRALRVVVMVEQERAPTEFPGFLRSTEGGYIKVEDFLTFIAGAAPGRGDAKKRAMAWLKRQGVTGPVESLSPQEVTRLTAAAQKAILGKKEREKRALPRLEKMVPPPPRELPEEPD